MVDMLRDHLDARDEEIERLHAKLDSEHEWNVSQRSTIMRWQNHAEKLESRLHNAAKMLDGLETWEHPDDPGKSIIDMKGYQLIEDVGDLLEGTVVEKRRHNWPVGPPHEPD